jgi:thymidylate kinase
MIDQALADAALDALVRAGITPCLLGGPPSGGDLDVVVERWRAVPAALAARAELRVVQRVRTAPKGVTYTLAWRAAERPGFLALDVAGEIRFGPALAFSAAQVLATARGHGAHLAPEPGVAFAAYAAKRIHKGDLGSPQGAWLRDLLLQAPVTAAANLARVLPRADAELVLRAVRGGDLAPITFALPALRRSMRGHLAHSPARLARMCRLIGRVLHPTGLVIAVIGPDGAGKSTLLDALTRELAPVFRRVVRRHLRPRLVRGRSGAGDGADPHGRRARGPVGSALQAALWTIDGWLGWAMLFLPTRVRASLLLFDRFADDLTLDPRRYRFGGPPWLARLPALLGPRPDVTLVLAAPAAAMAARKAELTVAEAATLAVAYRAHAARTPGALLIEQPTADAAALAAREAILGFLERRLA